MQTCHNDGSQTEQPRTRWLGDRVVAVEQPAAGIKWKAEEGAWGRYGAAAEDLLGSDIG